MNPCTVGCCEQAEAAGKASAQENRLPQGVNITTGPEGLDDSDLLEQGIVDALFHAVEPRCYRQGNPLVGRLFPDHREVEHVDYQH